MSKKDLVGHSRRGQSMSSQSQSTSRRKALKTALAGGAAVTVGAVPAKWVAPVVNSVMLPAHATTSQNSGPWFGVVGELDIGFYRSPAKQESQLYASANSAKQILGTVASNIADSLVQPANAQTNLEQDYLCVTPRDNEGGIRVVFQYYSENPIYAVTYRGTGVLGSSITLTSICESSEGPDSFVVSFRKRPDGSLDYSFVDKDSDSGVLPQSPCNFPDKDCPPDDNPQDTSG